MIYTMIVITYINNMGNWNIHRQYFTSREICEFVAEQVNANGKNTRNKVQQAKCLAGRQDGEIIN